MVIQNGIKPSNEHIKAVYNFLMPKNVLEIHIFIGFVISYFRKFIYNFSIIAAPLYDRELIKKNIKFVFEKK